MIHKRLQMSKQKTNLKKHLTFKLHSHLTSVQTFKIMCSKIRKRLAKVHYSFAKRICFLSRRNGKKKAQVNNNPIRWTKIAFFWSFIRFVCVVRIVHYSYCSFQAFVVQFLFPLIRCVYHFNAFTICLLLLLRP